MSVKPPGDLNDAAREEAQAYPYWRRNIHLMPLAMLLNAVGFSMATPFLPIMLRGFGITTHLETWTGFTVLAFYSVSFICNPFWGGIADHYGRKLNILRAMLGMGFFMALIPFAPSPLWFVFLFALVGFFNGSAPAAQALVIANTPPHSFGRALSRLQAGMVVGQIIGPAVATSMVALIDRPHWLFWFSGGLLLSAGGIVALFVHEVKQLAPDRWRPQWIGSLRMLLAVPHIGRLYMLNFVYGVLGAGNVAVLSIYVLQLVAAQGGDAAAGTFWVGAVAMGLAISSVVSLTAWGWVLDRFDPARMLAFTVIAACATQVPLLFLQTPLQLVIARVAFGLAVSVMPTCIVRLLKSAAPPGTDAQAISFAMSFQFMAMGLGPFVAGLIGPVFGLRAYFALITLVTAGAAWMWWRVGRRG